MIAAARRNLLASFGAVNYPDIWGRSLSGGRPRSDVVLTFTLVVLGVHPVLRHNHDVCAQFLSLFSGRAEPGVHSNIIHSSSWDRQKPRAPQAFESAQSRQCSHMIGSILAKCQSTPCSNANAWDIGSRKPTAHDYQENRPLSNELSREVV